MYMYILYKVWFSTINDKLFNEQSFSLRMHIIALDARTTMYKSPYELINVIPLRRLSLVGVILTEIFLILTL
jgi:hypothetical protein